MIGYLRGTLVSKTERDSLQLLLETNGVGYRVTVGKNTLTNLGSEGAEVMVYTSHQVREDSEVLYGFLNLEDRNAFELLLKIHKVGPSMAVEILDSYSLSQLHTIILKKDLDALTDISGIGKATAERLLTELKNKLDIPDIRIDTETEANDVKRVLLELGYTSSEIRTALAELPEDSKTQDMATEELVKLALNRLG